MVPTYSEPPSSSQYKRTTVKFQNKRYLLEEYFVINEPLMKIKMTNFHAWVLIVCFILEPTIIVKCHGFILCSVQRRVNTVISYVYQIIISWETIVGWLSCHDNNSDTCIVGMAGSDTE